MRKKEESSLQKVCVRWFRLTQKEAIIFAIPNGGSRNPLEARNLKLEGVLAGVPDLQIICNGKIFFVEMKTPKGKQQPSQRDFEERVKALGFRYYLCRSFEEFREIIREEIK